MHGKVELLNKGWKLNQKNLIRDKYKNMTSENKKHEFKKKIKQIEKKAFEIYLPNF